MKAKLIKESLNENRKFEINYGLMIVDARKQNEDYEILHFCGYEKPPTKIDAYSLREEIKNDPEFGLQDKWEFVDILLAPKDIVEKYKNIVFTDQPEGIWLNENQLFEQQKIYNINDLGSLMSRMGYGEKEVFHLVKILMDAYKKAGDEGVVDMYTKMTGTHIYPIRKGRYIFGEEPYDPDKI